MRGGYHIDRGGVLGEGEQEFGHPPLPSIWKCVGIYGNRPPLWGGRRGWFCLFGQVSII